MPGLSGIFPYPLDADKVRTYPTTGKALADVLNGGPPLSRYTFSRVANGVASGGLIDLGTPPATPWTTGAIVGTSSRITVTKACYLQLVATTSVTLASHAGVLTVASTLVTFDVVAATAGGNTFRTGGHFDGFLQAGETLDLAYRNSGTGAMNFTAKTVLTIGPATPGAVIQS